MNSENDKIIADRVDHFQESRAAMNAAGIDIYENHPFALATIHAAGCIYDANGVEIAEIRWQNNTLCWWEGYYRNGQSDFISGVSSVGGLPATMSFVKRYRKI